MQLARILHFRCDDYSDTTYVWVPDHETEDSFYDKVEAAEKEYLEYLEEFQKMQPVAGTLGYSYNFGAALEKNPEYYTEDLTLKECRELYKKANEEYKAYENAKTKAKNGLLHFLKKQGFHEFYREDILETEIWWGHRHGVDIDYSETKVKSYEFSKPNNY